MEPRCERFVASYLAWLKGQISVAEIEGVCEITLPFLDRHNDYIQIYVREMESKFVVSDDGFILGDLEMSGCSPDTPQRRHVLQTILQRLEVIEEEGELLVKATAENLPQKQQALIQSMLNIGDIYMMSHEMFQNMFLTEVIKFLDESGVRYTPDVRLGGISGYIHKFDFVIPKSRSSPERLLRAINKPTRQSSESLLFAGTDTKRARDPDSLIYAILNDHEQALNPNIVNAFNRYDIRTIVWSERERYRAELAA